MHGDITKLFFFQILGSIPWQEYYQRVLACRSTKEARLLTVGAAGLGYFFAVPSLLLGAAGACTGELGRCA